ncbi:hypothetical protein PAECIP111891_04489 [Paenibacillus allorhizoplanae]|uniref:SLH domain-containing protein n=1 Tax=Paenibacillus allorhizoplanae TaxID=2905648 RepID=A0ABM9CKC7_9BACL|nr:S-layer homology domain-containing protein [Paenibacillus allorhizoplanae]CAH1216847.1 hypothetical protein PAECIP111891_04489 [Paenibacillus allorhizoplanae]
MKFSKWFIVIVLFMVFSLMNWNKAFALSVPGGDANYSGEEVVWNASDTSGNTQIYYKNITTEETKQITNTPTSKRLAKVKDGLIVWQEKRDVPPDKQFDWNVYGYQLSSGVEKKLNVDPGAHSIPTTDGRYIAWYNNNATSELYIYDWTTDHVEQFGKGTFPIVSHGKVMFKPYNKPALGLYTIASHETKTVASVPQPGYVSWFVFNGSAGLFIHQKDTATQYMMVNVSESDPVVKELTPLTTKPRDFAVLVAGDSYMAWMEDKGGVAQIMSASVASGEVKQISSGTSDQVPLAFTGNMLLSTENFSAVKTESITSYFAAPQTGVSLPLPLPLQSSIKVKLGPAGGVVTSKDGSISIEFVPGSWQAETEVELQEVTSLAAAQSPVEPMQLKSRVWRIHWGTPPYQPGELQLSHNDAEVLPSETKKLAIYTYSPDQGWSFKGGKVDGKTKKVQSKFEEEGTFAVLLYDAKFKDVEKHWAQTPIEVLAARRILNGVEDGVFQPNAKLTRAQFTKMLAAATGLKPAAAQGRFADVPADYWGAGWIEAAASQGLVEGGDQGFLPDTELTREQMMAMLIRAVGKEKEADQMTDALSFADAKEISSWAQGYAALAVKLGFVEGSAEGIRPQATSTRAEAAMVIYRLLINQDKI